MLFINSKIRKLEKAGYTVLTEEETKTYDEICENYGKLKRHDIKVTKKYNNLLKDSVSTLTIKAMREQLATAGVTTLPTKKAELIDLYITTFEE